MSAPAQALPLAVLRRGSEEPPPRRTPLCAGPLRLVLEETGLRSIRLRLRLGEIEVIRGIYAAARDANWCTAPAAIRELRVDARDDSFQVHFEVENRLGEIDFAWRGEITGEPSGRIDFAMDGVARSSFRRNRIGFCVLHPAGECAGVRCRVRHSDGCEEESRFPRAISPHQPFRDIAGIAHEVAPGVWVDLAFAGEVFEMEDQRNWTDASFKTYCTPLERPFPVEVTAGTRIEQRVTLSLALERRGALGAPVASGARQAGTRRPDEVHLAVSAAGSGRLPELGVAVASHAVPLSARAVERLRSLSLSHLRAEIRRGQSDWPDALRRAAAESRALVLPLEAALFLPQGREETALRELAERLAGASVEVRRFLVYHERELSASGSWAELARRVLGPRFPRAAIGCGTNANFTELNRRPPAGALFDFVCYGLQPQEHAGDDATLVENLAAQASTVESARSLIGGRAVVVSPVTLRKRFNPYATCAEHPPPPGELPPQVDPRQMALFGAGWTLGSVKVLAESGAASATYYETSGWRGVLELEDGPPLLQRFRSLPGGVFPLYHVLADLGERRDATVLRSRSSDPLRLEGIALRERDGRTRVLAANLTGEPLRAVLEPGSARVRARFLDETNALEAMSVPEEFRRRDGSPCEVRGRALELALLPYAVACVDIDPE